MNNIQIYGKHLGKVFICTVIENNGNTYTYIKDMDTEVELAVEFIRPDFDTEIRKGIYVPFIERHVNSVNEMIKKEFNCLEEIDILEFTACIAYQAMSIFPGILK